MIFLRKEMCRHPLLLLGILLHSYTLNSQNQEKCRITAALVNNLHNKWLLWVWILSTAPSVLIDIAKLFEKSPMFFKSSFTMKWRSSAWFEGLRYLKSSPWHSKALHCFVAPEIISSHVSKLPRRPWPSTEGAMLVIIKNGDHVTTNFATQWFVSFTNPALYGSLVKYPWLFKGFDAVSSTCGQVRFKFLMRVNGWYLFVFLVSQNLFANPVERFWWKTICVSRFEGPRSLRLYLKWISEFRSIGCGKLALNSSCSSMNMPCLIPKASYQKSQESNRPTSETLEKSESVAVVKRYEEIGGEPDQDWILDIGVSFDGTWQKRGHSSHNGVGPVIDLLTSWPIDSSILSNYCYKCTTEPKKDDPDWMASHKPNC